MTDTDTENRAPAEPDAYPDWPQAAAEWLAMLDPEELEAEVLRRCGWGKDPASVYVEVLVDWITGNTTPRTGDENGDEAPGEPG